MRSGNTAARWWRGGLAAASAFALATSLAACGSSPESGSGPKDDPNAQILVWTDATRKPAFEAYQKAHPNVKLKIEVIDATALLTKIQLANRVNKGWPDVVFDSLPSDVAALASPLFKFAQPLNDKVPGDVQANFAGDNATCTIDGKLYCLQNDLAQDVLWYNKKQMDKFGYTVPTTWAEYQTLGAKVAKEHPGYVLGAAGGANIYYDYLWSSGCPLQKVISSTQVEINAKDAKCTRVAETLDPMLANGSLSRLGPFDPEMNKLAKAGKLLMIPAASWFGEFVMKPDTGYDMADGQVAAAPMPTWDGESTNYSGAQGGGIYLVSSHAKNMSGATDVAQWIATSKEYQSTAPTYPAYKPAAAAWLAKVKDDGFYAEDPSAVLTDAAPKINPVESPTRYPVEGPINSTLVAAITGGKTIASAFEALQTQLAGLAASSGYEVTP
jgi:multiple sugar transport system substrate-binding protein